MGFRRHRALLDVPVSRRLGRVAASLGAFVLASLLANSLSHSVSRAEPPRWTRTVDSAIQSAPGSEKVLFIVIDALRRDHLGTGGYERDTSPTIDRLASEGTLFAHATVHAPQTVPSMLSILTSTLPSEHGVQYDAESGAFGTTGEMAAPTVDRDRVLMAELFAAAGFHTAAVVANPWLRASYGFGQGFAEFMELDGGDGRDIVDAAQRILSEQRDRKTFVYLHFMDVHSPYSGIPADHRGLRPSFQRPELGRYRYTNGKARGTRAEDLAYTMALYDEGVFYVDQLIARLVEFLSTQDLTRDTTIVIVSDHGDEFMEHGGLGHGTTLHAELLNSFAIFWNPARFRARRMETCARGIDILPTLLQAHRVEVPAGLRGRDLIGPGSRAACEAEAISELAGRKSLTARRWKLVHEVSSGEEKLDYLGADGLPAESQPQMEPAALDAMRRRIGQVVVQAAASRSGAGALDARDAERLRQLGYLR